MADVHGERVPVKKVQEERTRMFTRVSAKCLLALLLFSFAPITAFCQEDPIGLPYVVYSNPPEEVYKQWSTYAIANNVPSCEYEENADAAGVKVMTCVLNSRAPLQPPYIIPTPTNTLIRFSATDKVGYFPTPEWCMANATKNIARVWSELLKAIVSTCNAVGGTFHSTNIYMATYDCYKSTWTLDWEGYTSINLTGVCAK